MAFQLLQTWQDAGKMLEILVLRSIISCVSQVEVPDLGFEAFIQINVHIFNPPPQKKEKDFQRFPEPRFHIKGWFQIPCRGVQ